RGAIVPDGYEPAQIVFRIGLNIVDMNRSSLEQSPANDRASTWLYGDGLQILFVFQPLLGFSCHSVARDKTVAALLGPPNVRHFCVAQPRRRLDQRVEHGLQVKGGAADDLEHVGGGGLLLERFAQLVEQARILDGDDGLAGEALYQLDLLVGKGTNLLTVNGKDAN